MARSELGGDGGVCNKGWTKKQTSDPAGNTNLPSPVDCMAYTPVPTHSILPFLPSFSPEGEIPGVAAVTWGNRDRASSIGHGANVCADDTGQ